jgi:hypothetical protein
MWREPQKLWRLQIAANSLSAEPNTAKLYQNGRMRPIWNGRGLPAQESVLVPATNNVMLKL